MEAFLFDLFNAQMHGGVPSCNPRMQYRGGRGRKGVQELKGIARDGTRWPCRRGDPTKLNQTVQLAGRFPFGEVSRIAKPQRRRGAERRQKAIHWHFSASLRLCGSAIVFGRECEWGCSLE